MQSNIGFTDSDAADVLHALANREERAHFYIKRLDTEFPEEERDIDENVKALFLNDFKAILDDLLILFGDMDGDELGEAFCEGMINFNFNPKFWTVLMTDFFAPENSLDNNALKQMSMNLGRISAGFSGFDFEINGTRRTGFGFMKNFLFKLYSEFSLNEVEIFKQSVLMPLIRLINKALACRAISSESDPRRIIGFANEIVDKSMFNGFTSNNVFNVLRKLEKNKETGIFSNADKKRIERLTQKRGSFERALNRYGKALCLMLLPDLRKNLNMSIKSNDVLNLLEDQFTYLESVIKKKIDQERRENQQYIDIQRLGTNIEILKTDSLKSKKTLEIERKEAQVQSALYENCKGIVVSCLEKLNEAENLDDFLFILEDSIKKLEEMSNSRYIDSSIIWSDLEEPSPGNPDLRGRAKIEDLTTVLKNHKQFSQNLGFLQDQAEEMKNNFRQRIDKMIGIFYELQNEMMDLNEKNANEVLETDKSNNGKKTKGARSFIKIITGKFRVPDDAVVGEAKVNRAKNLVSMARVRIFGKSGMRASQ